jgi:hypothetical protein
VKFNLFSLDLPDEALNAFKALASVVIITGSSLGDEYAIVPTGTYEKYLPGTICYTPEECRYLLGLDGVAPKEVHKMKKYFGGSVIPVNG